MAKDVGEPDYPVILYFTQHGKDPEAPVAWSLTKGYEVISEGSSLFPRSAEASAAASVLFLGNRKKVYTNSERLRDRLITSGMDNLSSVEEFKVLQFGIKEFAFNNNLAILNRVVAARENSKTEVPSLEVAPQPVLREKTSPKGINKYGSLPRLTIATDASLSQTHSIAGISWVAEDGRHSINRVDVGEGGSTIAELWAIHSILPSIHKLQKLLVQSDCFPAIQAFLDRKKILSEKHKHVAKKIAVLEAIEREMEHRDIEIMWVKGHDGYALNETADQLAKFARRKYESGDDSPSSWEPIDRILLDGLGFDRKAQCFVNEMAASTTA